MAKAAKNPRRKQEGKGPPSGKSGGSLSTGVLARRKAKTHKGRQILAAREAESFPGVKSLLLMRGGRCSANLQGLLGDLRDLKKPQAVFLSQRPQKDLHPFEDAEPIEYLTKKNGCGLFAFASTSKKRPARLVLGRVYDHEVLDMNEFAVSHYVPASSFSGVQAPRAGSVPLVLMQGGLWESSEELKNLRNVFADFFRGVAAPPDGPPQTLFLSGIDRIVAVSAVQCSGAAPAASETSKDDSKLPAEAATAAPAAGTTSGAPGVLICIRHYRVVMLRQDGGSSKSRPRVKLEEVGPQIDLKLDRMRLPSAEKWRAATKTLEKARAEESRTKQKAAKEAGEATQGPPKKKSKNIKTNIFGDSVGRVFVEKPDLARLKQIQCPMLHKMQRAAGQKKPKSKATTETQAE